MLSKSKNFFWIFYLIGITTAVNGVPMHKTVVVDESLIVESLPVQSGCFDPSQSPSTALVAFVHGGVFDQHGNPINAGSELQAEDVVIVESDGFLALDIANTRTVNVQPDTATSVACAVTTQLELGALDFTQPYRLGAIRG